MLTSLTPGNNLTDTDMISIKEPTARMAGGIKLKNAKSTAAKAEEIANEFESQFVSQMLSNMFSTVDRTEALGGNDSEEVYESMLINEYGKIIARTGGVGVAAHVKQMLISQQEVQ